MRDVERALDSLAPAPGGLPPSIATVLRARRTRRRNLVALAATAPLALLAVGAAVILRSTYISHASRTSPVISAIEIPDSPYALAVLTRCNRDLDPDRLVLRDLAPGAPDPSLRPGDARTYLP